jgi:hypothetical protein
MKTIDQLLNDGTRYCYYLNESEPEPNWESFGYDFPTRFRVSLVFEGESGHYPTGGGDVEPWYWDRNTCRVRNERHGLNDSDVAEIIAGSMFATA